MGLKNVKPIVGLLIIVPVVIGMLAFGIYNWPEGKNAEQLMRRTQEIKDSIKMAETPKEFK